ncbi:TRAP transporter substrate-binding protein [Hippea maritima]|uniref:TRAP dicarboxylate transporter, DctP subunit n=1 Tax=Hippea maritima (strain ATCC 700847 / DSM 10411 / MH2) TaxID=760142 RepID=F2LX72_HIPMA|nr:TRAP transporter substrate-binding protein [Hippea maritima]AEA33130.1 TRAP dicarboxylate transporter, DctP subunit [Hippea maritima DSM 10411]
MKKLMFAVLLFLFVVSSAFAKTYTINLGIVTTPKTFHYKAALKLKQIVEKESHGQIKVIIHYSGSVGNETDILQQLQMGALQMGVITAGPIDKFVPAIKAIEFPFIFNSYKQADEILDGKIGRAILNEFPKANLIGYHFLENGFRNLTNSVRPVHSAKDLKGLKIRVMNSQFHVKIWRALGANPTPMPWPIYTQLAQHVIDGQENPLAVIYQYKLYEVQKYLTLTRHVYSALVFVGSKSFYNSLPDKYKKLMFEATKEASIYERNLNREKAAFFLDELKKHGMIVDEHPDIESFKKRVEPLKNQFHGVARKYLDEILTYEKNSQN